MTIEHKTPKARREARSYCRRCLAVMLCCVLAFGLTVRTAPRAKAAITEAAVVGSWGSDALLGSIGFASLVGSGGYDYRQSTIIGSDITNPDITNADILYHGYEEGYQLGLDIENSLLGEAARLWLAGVKAFFRDKGGVAAGDSFEIPAEIAEAIRQWSVENLDLTDGAATYTNRGLFSADSQMVFTSFPSGYAYNQVPVGTVTVGTVVPYGGSLTISFTDADGLPWELK